MPVSAQRQTADKLVAAFNRMDIDTIISLRSPECMRHILPASMGHAATTNEQYQASLEKLKVIFHNFELTPHDIIEDKEACRICMYLTARADTLAGEYVNEYMWTMDFDAAGEKIVNWTEFTDSVVNRDFWPKLQASMKAHKARAAIAS